MANPFLNNDNHDVETAIMLEQAIIHDIGKAVAYTDGDRIFINTDDNLFNILPAYDHNMLKWLLWHERYHKELRHHNRFFRYLNELDEEHAMDEFHVTKEEVNIIMDILVHDSLSKLFPELVETAMNNLAQMRHSNSLSYDFKYKTLEKMLQEYAEFKRKAGGDPKGGTGGGTGGTDLDSKKKTKPSDEPTPSEPESPKGKSPEPKDEKSTETDDHTSTSAPASHDEGGDTDERSTDKPEETPELNPDAPTPESKDPKPAEGHSKPDWSKLDDIDTKEFISRTEADRYIDQVKELKRKKFKLGKLTQTLNGLATTTRTRSYAMPSTIQPGHGVLLKGRTPGKTALYLCFDASGSMGCEMETFKDIISKSIPQAMDVPTVWFSGDNSPIAPDPDGRSYDYYKGRFRDFMPVYANCGYSDDGDRTIELCWLAEQQGYSPIGVTDGGGQISWATDMLKQLKRTVFVGQSKRWLDNAKRINPNIQTIDI